MKAKIRIPYFEIGIKNFLYGDDVLKLAMAADQAAAQDDQYGDILKLKTARLSFGRIAALAVRQAITQKTRDAEREAVYNEYADRKGHLVTGVVRRLERGNLIVEIRVMLWDHPDQKVIDLMRSLREGLFL